MSSTLTDSIAPLTFEEKLARTLEAAKARYQVTVVDRETGRIIDLKHCDEYVQFDVGRVLFAEHRRFAAGLVRR